MQDRIAIFRAGTHRDDKGRTFDFTEADILSMAAVYDPALHMAPHVLGHPKTDDPAWAWTAGVEARDGTLYSLQEKIDPAFAQAVDAGRYRMRSASFYEPNDPANPKPGSWYLRHVGWLGAQPPSVKGLGAAFSEGDVSEGVTFAETDLSLAWLAGNVSDGFRRLRDFFIEKFGLEAADKAIPDWTDRAAASIASDVRAEINLENGERVSAMFSEAQAALTATEAAAAELAARAADLDTREAGLAERESRAQADRVAFAEGTRTAARTEDATFVDGLVDAGRLPPARADLVKTLLGVLDGDQTVAFAEADTSVRDQFRELLGGLGVSITFAEVAPSEGVRFAENATPEQYAVEIRAIQAAAAERGETLSASQAAGRIGR